MNSFNISDLYPSWDGDSIPSSFYAMMEKDQKEWGKYSTVKRKDSGGMDEVQGACRPG